MSDLEKQLRITQKLGDDRGEIVYSLITDLEKLSCDQTVPLLIRLALEGLKNKASHKYDTADHRYRESYRGLETP